MQSLLPQATKVAMLATLATVAFATPALAGASEPLLVSRASGVDGVKANAPSEDASVSADGRFVAFQTEATNLDPADTTDRADIYVRDVVAGTTELASRASGGDGPVGDAYSVDPAISDDGRFVAFESSSGNLDPTVAVAPGVRQVYVRDLVTQTTTLVSRADGPEGLPAETDAADPAISADGRLVAFYMDSPSLDPDGQVWLRDLAAQSTTLVSRASGAAGAPGNSISSTPAISPSGTAVAFKSSAKNFGFPGHTSLIYARDLATATTELASRKTGPSGRPRGTNDEPDISANGTRVAFTGAGLDPREGPVPNLDVYVRDFARDRTIWVSQGVPGANTRRPPTINSDAPAISDDGRFVAFGAAPRTGVDSKKDRQRTRPQVFVRDLKKERLIAVEDAVGRRGATLQPRPSLSADAQWIAFESNQRRLDPDDGDTKPDIYLLRVRG